MAHLRNGCGYFSGPLWLNERTSVAHRAEFTSDPAEIRNGFKELDDLMGDLSLDDNNAVWNLCCQLCTAYEHKAFLDGFQYGAHLMLELHK